MAKYWAHVLSFLTLAGICLCQVEVDKHSVINRKDRTFFSDCNDARIAGYTRSGVYKLTMLTNTSREHFHIYCEHAANNSFNVIQRRQDGSYRFDVSMYNYINGFGSAGGTYWAGLNSIFYLTSTGNNNLDIQLRDWSGNIQNVQYTYFSLSGYPSYILNIGGYRGQIPDDMSFSRGQKFSTIDQPDHYDCASGQKAGWWYNYCAYALLNGHYYPKGNYTPSGGFYDGIYWKDWTDYGYSLKFTQMMLSK